MKKSQLKAGVAVIFTCEYGRSTRTGQPATILFIDGNGNIDESSIRIEFADGHTMWAFSEELSSLKNK